MNDIFITKDSVAPLLNYWVAKPVYCCNTLPTNFQNLRLMITGIMQLDYIGL